ncbi:TAXI family TRAP transporter solute-binding subunit [Nocardia sp. NPDC020380]|uniref:TAXI family TRAP transporter solute-binding subunit n=1 Tax=Nocardia sp. NPDC020380 TaxID=3364309 RepID=UPI0037999429
MQTRPSEPKIDRNLTLHLRGDWGAANLHRICGWISQELIDRAGPATRIAIWNGRGGTDAIHAVGRGEVDIALTTPAAFAAAALDGRGVYTDTPYPQLRALGTIPHRDRLVLAVNKSLGITTFAELRAGAPQLRLATGPNDGINNTGLAAHTVLDRAGIDVTAWGGEFLPDERPFGSFAHILSGRANAIFQEAIMFPAWQQFAPNYNFLPIEDPILTALESAYSWPPATIPAAYFPGAAPIRTLDFADFLLLTTTALPDDLAYAVAWTLGETRHHFEAQYHHLPPELSPITYPLDPPTMGHTPIPLHPAAAHYYEAL